MTRSPNPPRSPVSSKLRPKATTKAKTRLRAPSKSNAGATGADAESQLKGFIDKFDPKNQTLIRAARAVMRARYPTAVEMVYDNYNFFVIGYGPSDRASKAIFSLAAAANGLALCFLFGATLKDPTGILRGAGNQVRSIRLPSVDVLDEKPVRDLMAAAVAQSPEPLAAKGKGELIIKSISAKQRPRQRVRS